MHFNSITFTSEYTLEVQPIGNINAHVPFVLAGGIVNVAKGLNVSFVRPSWYPQYQMPISFIKEGLGTLTIEHIGSAPYSNSWFGPPVVINEGTLATSGVLSSRSPSLTIGAKGTLKVLSSNALIPPIFGTGIIQLDASISLGNLSNFSGTIRGSGGLVYTSPGIVSGEYDFTGDSTIATTLDVNSLANAGVRSPLGAGDKIGLTGRLTISAQTPVSTNREFAIAGHGVIAVSSPTGFVTVNGPVSQSSAGFLTKSGPGTLRLSNPNNSFQTVTISEGTLQSRFSDPQLGTIGWITFGSLGKRGHLEVPEGISDETVRVVDVVGGGGQISLPGSTISIKGAIRGSAPLTLSGSGAAASTVVIAPSTTASSHTGRLALEQVTVRVVNGSGISDSAQVDLGTNAGSRLVLEQGDVIGSLAGGGGINSGRVTVNEGLVIVGVASTEFAGLIDGSGSLVKLGVDTDLSLTGLSTFTGDLIVSAGSLSVPGIANSGVASPLGSGNQVRLGSDNVLRPTLRITGGYSSASNRVLKLTGSGGSIDVAEIGSTVVWAGQVEGGSASQLRKVGSGTLRLAGANGFSGSVNVSDGILQVVGGNALPNNGVATVAAGAKLEIRAGGSETIGSLEGAGDIDLGSRLITGGNDLSSTFTGIISGSGINPLIKRGSGTFTLANLGSSFSGGIHIADGAVSVPAIANNGVNSPLGMSGAITLGDEDHIGRLIVTHSGFAATDRAFTLMPGGGAIDVSNSAGELAITAPILGDGDLVKLGSGRLRITSDTIGTGRVVVADGTLEISGNIPGAITISDPGVLETSGAANVSVGAVNLAGGEVALGAPGVAASLGTGALTLSEGILAFDLQSSSKHDQIIVSGTVLVSGPVVLMINLQADPQDFEDVYRLVLNDGNDITTVFNEASQFIYQGNLLDEGETFLVSSGEYAQYFQMHYGTTSDDNDIRIVAAPEPGSAAMLLGGALCLFGQRKRRRAA